MEIMDQAAFIGKDSREIIKAHPKYIRTLIIFLLEVRNISKSMNVEIMIQFF